MSNLVEQIQSSKALIVRQRFEAAELFGYETRNKYDIQTETGQAVGFAAEQHKGFLNFIFRQFFGHWRTFDIFFFDLETRSPELIRISNTPMADERVPLDQLLHVGHLERHPGHVRHNPCGPSANRWRSVQRGPHSRAPH